MNTSFSNKQLFIPSLLLVSILAATLYIPSLHESYQFNKETILQKETELSRKTSELEQLSKQHTEFLALSKEKQEEIINLFFDKFEQEEILSSLEDIKKASGGITISGITFREDPRDQNKTMNGTSVSLDVTTATKEGFAQIVSLLEKQKRLMNISALTLQSDATQNRGNITFTVYASH